MRDPTMLSDRALDLLAELCEASARAHTDATLTPVVEEILARHLGLERVELRRGEEAPVRPEIRPEGGSILAVFAIGGRGRPIGRAVLATRASEGEVELTGALCAAIGRVVGVAFDHVDLLARVAGIARKTAEEKKLLREENARIALPKEIVAVGPAMRAIVHDAVPLVAGQSTTVLLRGETGTGKEVIARRIHALSRRATRPFVAVNCGALPDGLLESALFGHERGAFTGAVARHVGLFERAHRGTLLLDEVGELPKAAQAKLLRVLQEGEIERVGGAAPVRVDVRILAATHRPLEDMVASGAFREDLYYRLSVFPITLPPLRDRPEDLASLVHVLLAALAQKLGRPALRLSNDVLARLRAHPWPGNLRELENVLERAALLSKGEELILPDGWDARPAPARAPESAATYRDAVRDHLQQALRASGGKIYGEGGAAKALGLKPTTLQSKLRKLGIKP